MRGTTRIKKFKPVKVPRTFQPRFWAEVDGRKGVKLELLRRYRQLKKDCNVDNYAKELLCQRAAFISIQLETMERDLTEGRDASEGRYGQLSNVLSGLLTKLGLAPADGKTSDDDLHLYLKRRRND